MFDLSDLSRFRDDTADPEAWKPEPIRADPEMRVLAFDQSIANTGWVILQGALVLRSGNLKTEPIDKGHEDTLRRAVDLMGQVTPVIGGNSPTIVAHETPPAGGKMVRPESSLVAAAVIRCAANMYPIRMVGAQRAKKRLTNNGNAKKTEVREAIKALDPRVLTLKPLNEAIYDAIAVGWVAAEEESKRLGRI